MTTVKKTEFVLDVAFKNTRNIFKIQFSSEHYFDCIDICSNIIKKQLLNRFDLNDFLMQYNNIENALNMLPNPYDNILPFITLNTIQVINNVKLCIKINKCDDKMTIKINDESNRELSFTLYMRDKYVSLIN
jgi:hypothetical protein